MPEHFTNTSVQNMFQIHQKNIKCNSLSEQGTSEISFLKGNFLVFLRWNINKIPNQSALHYHASICLFSSTYYLPSLAQILNNFLLCSKFLLIKCIAFFPTHSYLKLTLFTHMLQHKEVSSNISGFKWIHITGKNYA